MKAFFLALAVIAVITIVVLFRLLKLLKGINGNKTQISDSKVFRLKLEIISAIVILFIVIVVGYGTLEAFITLYQIKTGIKHHDAEELSENIDFTKLRSNLKEQLNNEVMKKVSSELKNNPFGLAGALFASKIVDLMVDNYVTPSGLATLMAGKRPQTSLSSNQIQTDNVQNFNLFKNARFTYDSTRKFSVWVKNNNVGEIRVIFTRQWLSWKLTNIIIPPSETLFVAAGNGHIDTVRTLLDSGVNVNQTDELGRTPLWVAILMGHIDVVKLLLAHGANVNQVGKTRQTLIEAAMGHIDVVKLLLAHGVNINKDDLFYAANGGYADVVKILLAHGANVNQANTMGDTPLGGAVIADHAEVVIILLSNGANVNQTDKEGRTPLDLAESYGLTNLVKILLAHGGHN